MFGLSRLARHARQWRANHKRAAMENLLMDLPAHLRKDIGWPAAKDHPTCRQMQGEIPARPNA